MTGRISPRVRMVRPLFVVLTVIAALLCTTLVLTPSATAGDGVPSNVGGTISVGGGVDKGSSKGGTSSGGGASAGPGWHWSYGSLTCPKKGRCGFNWDGGDGGYVHKVASCMTRSEGGIRDWRATGISYQYQTRNDPKESPHEKDWDATCNYPPPPTSVPIRCSYSVTAKIARVRNTAVTLFAKTVKSSWATDTTSAEKCPALTSVTANAALRTLGAFQVDFRAVAFPCILRTTYGPNGGSRIIRCGNPITKTVQFKPEQWCDGTVRFTLNAGWGHGPIYGWSGCAGTETEIVHCGWTGKPTYDGKATPVSVLDDGMARNVGFGRLRLTGPIVSVSNLRSSLRYVKGTPFRADGFVTDDDQPFLIDTGKTAGDRTTWPLAFLHAGMPDHPFTLRKRVTFDAKIRVQMSVITSIDFDGTVHTKKVSTTVDATGMHCDSPSAEIAVSRARNSSN
jgi:hypothetical protein